MTFLFRTRQAVNLLTFGRERLVSPQRVLMLPAFTSPNFSRASGALAAANRSGCASGSESLGSGEE